MSRITRVVAVAAAALLMSPSTASAAQSTVFSGQATVVKGTVLGIPISLVDTGPVAAEGGALERSLLCYPNAANCTVGLPDVTNGAVQAQVLHAAVVAQGNKSRAEASVANLAVDAAGQSIGAEFLAAHAEARCADGKASVTGSAEVVALVVNGTAIKVAGDVNETIPLPGGGFVILNEQVGSATADSGDLTVNALHITIPGPIPGTDTDLIVAQAHADIVCATPAPACPSAKDFVTGGGFTLSPMGAKRHFAVAGGIKNGFWGHLMYSDRAAGLRVKGTGVTAYVNPGIFGPTSRHIEGTADINGSPGTYAVDVSDLGEPGRNDDFRITLSNGYTAYGKLAGGNIALHTCK